MTEAEVRIDSIAAGGDGVARHDGLVVFVPRAAPGDVARIRYASKGRFARGEVLRIVSPSDLRVDAPCDHYTTDRCGGCQVQHLRYEAQLAAKGQIVADAMERIGRQRVALPPAHASPRQWRYRRKLTLALRRTERGWIAGLHPYDAPGRIFSLRDCPITDERVLGAWRGVLRNAALLPAAGALRGAVRVDAEVNAVSFVLEGGRTWRESSRFFDLTGELTELWWIAEGEPRRLLHRRDRDAPPGVVFTQVNSEMAVVLRAHVLSAIGERVSARVIDAYAGTGETAIALARSGADVIAIELDPDASAWCGAQLPPGSRAIAARVEDVLDELLPADLVLLNPPRAGVHERVSGALAARRPPGVIYVSCNPATLARDIARLPGYTVQSVRAFDMFPQTAHVETVCVLRAEAAA